MPEKPVQFKQSIVTPNLMKEKYFQSEHAESPEHSDYEEETPKPSAKKT